VALTQIHKDDAVLLAESDALLVVITFGIVAVRHLERMKEVADERIGQFGKIGLLFVSLETPGGLKISNEVRSRAVEITRSIDASLQGTAIVLKFGGLSGIVARTFVGFVNRLAGNHAPQKTTSEVADGLAWLSTLPGLAATARDPQLGAELERLIAGLGRIS
jgi:hypothetical protein